MKPSGTYIGLVLLQLSLFLMGWHYMQINQKLKMSMLIASTRKGKYWDHV